MTFTPFCVHARDIAIVAHPAVPVQELRLEDVREIFLGEQQFVDGTRVKLLDHRENSDLKIAFLTAVLRLTAPKYKTYWVQRVFQGYGFPPTVLAKEEILGRVQKERGAFSYLWLDEISDRSAVKIVFTVSVPS